MPNIERKYVKNKSLFDAKESLDLESRMSIICKGAAESSPIIVRLRTLITSCYAWAPVPIISTIALPLPLQAAMPQQIATAPASEHGPVARWRGKTIVHQNGFEPADTIDDLPAAVGKWSPNWIGAAKPSQTSVAIRLRRRFTLSHLQLSRPVLADVSADKVFRLWVNGVLVARGPDMAGGDYGTPLRWSHDWLYSQVDIAPYLKAGENVIAAEVFGSKTISGLSLEATAFAFRATVNNGNTPILLDSGSAWKAVTCDCYNDGPLADPKLSTTAALLYDAREDTLGWRGAGYDDRRWLPAYKIASRWGKLSPTGIPARMETEWPIASVVGNSVRLSDREIALPGNGSFVVRFDRVLAAYISAQMRGTTGTIVTFLPLETDGQAKLKRPLQVTLGSGLTSMESPGYDSFSLIKVVVANATGPIRFENVRAIATSQPLSYIGEFESSDENLNRLWKSIRWSLQLCLQDRYLDSPLHQELLPDPGDYFIEALGNYYSFNEKMVTRQTIIQFGEILASNSFTNFHTSYALLWVQMLVDYYHYTGDATLIQRFAPVVDGVMDRFGSFRGSDGLLSEAPNYLFMDWGKSNGYELHHPPAMMGTGYLTAFYYQALDNAALVAQMAGTSSKQHQYEALRVQVRSAFERVLWDKDAGLYRDGLPFRNHQPLNRWLPADRAGLVTHTPQLNVLAVLYGLAPTERGRTIIEKVVEQPPLTLQPYFMHFLFDAEAKVGLFDRHAWNQMQWWHLNPATGTIRERWAGGDWSHAWGGTPLIQMSSRILGVTPAEPGYAKVAITPQVNGLAWAKGVVPTVRGSVNVNWQRSDGSFVLHVVTPANMPALVTVPFTDQPGAKWSVDGQPEQRRVILATPGAHVFKVDAPGIPAG